MIILALLLLILSLILELLVIFIVGQKTKLVATIISSISVILMTFSTTFLISIEISIFSFLLFIFAIFRFINISRIIKSNMNHKELRKRTLATTSILGFSSLLVIIYYVSTPLDLTLHEKMLYIACLQFVISILLFTSVFIARTFFRYRTSLSIPKSLPSVTVCIPARNETKDLPDCIESILASTYHKLEILVLDDCSHDNTPDIIKKYAHGGVRFIKGKVPHDSWLAKNAAYDRLADEARGDILLFAGVDVRFNKNSITEIVLQLQNKDMISILPKRSTASGGAVLFQPLRYWWELGLWRFSIGTPPVLSTCWAVRSKIFKDMGGFDSVKKAVVPEAVFAKTFAKQKKYSFLVANDIVGITSEKAPKEQFKTSVRTRYIQLRKRPEAVLAVFLIELLFILGPYVTFFWAITCTSTSVLVISMVSIALIALSNAEVYKLALNKFWLLGLITPPLLAVTDWFLMAKSMYGYEFGKIIWKDRNICLPIHLAEKELPKI